MENKAYWFRIAIKILIPVMFMVIANITKFVNYETTNAIAGVMLVLVVVYYALIWQKIGEKRIKPK
jgi:hypothetical protein